MGSTVDNGEKRKRHPRGIFERPKASGVWWVLYFDDRGKRHREKVGPKSLAIDVYAKRKNEVRERRFFPEDIRRREVPLAAVIDDYLERNRGTLRWMDHYERYGRFWKGVFKGKTLREILPGDVERAIAKRRTQGSVRRGKDQKRRPLAPASINRELAFLRRVFNVAVADQKIETNPVRPSFFTRENNQRVRYLTDDEEQGLRKAIGELHWPTVAVALHTGLRRAEQFGLRWEHADFQAGVLTIPRSKSGKTRHVPMNETVRDTLRALPSRLKSEWVFPSITGETPLDAQNFYNRVFIPAVKRAGITGFTWHSLRHTFASRLAMAGVPLRTVQELLGHQSVTMTLRYAHLSPEHQLDAVRKLDSGGRTATRTATSPEQAKTAARVGEQVGDVTGETSGGAWNRTTDLGIMRPSL
jgi:integrase